MDEVFPASNNLAREGKRANLVVSGQCQKEDGATSSLFRWGAAFSPEGLSPKVASSQRQLRPKDSSNQLLKLIGAGLTQHVLSVSRITKCSSEKTSSAVHNVLAINVLLGRPAERSCNDRVRAASVRSRAFGALSSGKIARYSF